MTEQVLKDLNKPGRSSKKFVVASVAMALNVLVVCLGMWFFSAIYGTKPEAADWFGFGGFMAMTLAAFNTMPLGYVGGTAWQEKAIRVAAIGKGMKEEENAVATPES